MSFAFQSSSQRDPTQKLRLSFTICAFCKPFRILLKTQDSGCSSTWHNMAPLCPCYVFVNKAGQLRVTKSKLDQICFPNGRFFGVLINGCESSHAKLGGPILQVKVEMIVSGSSSDLGALAFKRWSKWDHQQGRDSNRFFWKQMLNEGDVGKETLYMNYVCFIFVYNIISLYVFGI